MVLLGFIINAPIGSNDCLLAGAIVTGGQQGDGVDAAGITMMWNIDSLQLLWFVRKCNLNRCLYESDPNPSWQ